MRKKTVITLFLVLLSIVGLVAGIYFVNKHQQLEAMKEYVEHVQSPYERHYLNENGTITAEISNTPIQYLDKETNEWKPINTSIKEKDQKYVVDEHVFRATFGKKGNEPVTFAQDGYRISYIPVNANESIADVQENEITYAEVWKHTDLQYEVTPTGLKMTLHLSDEQAPKEFAFKMLVDGMNPKLDENGSIVFFDEDGQEKFTIPTMWVKDSSENTVEMYDRLKVTLSEEQEGKYLLNLKVDDTNLVYPLIIDPTTTISGSSKVVDAYTGMNYTAISGNDDYGTYDTTTLALRTYGWGKSSVSNNTALIKFDIMGIPEGSLINSAKIRLFIIDAAEDDGGGQYYIRFTRLLSGWREDNVNIANLPSQALIRKHYFNCSNSRGQKCIQNQWFELDTTAEIYDMVQRTIPNYGFAFSLDKDDRWDSDYEEIIMNIASSETSNSPQLVVDYVPPTDWRGGAEQTVIITGVQDTWIQYQPDNRRTVYNYPNERTLRAGYEYKEGNGSDYRRNYYYAYIKFPNVSSQIPQDVRIKRALLYVRKESDPYGRSSP